MGKKSKLLICVGILLALTVPNILTLFNSKREEVKNNINVGHATESKIKDDNTFNSIGSTNQTEQKALDKEFVDNDDITTNTEIIVDKEMDITKDAYDKKYKASDEASKKAFNNEFIQQTKEPQLSAKNTYRIFNDLCSVSYDYGNNWVDVPILLEDLCHVMDGNSYLNKLQNGSYIISPERTIFTYGGTTDTTLSIIKSTDKGKTWENVQVDKEHKIIYSGRLKFISFVSEKVGYIVVTTERVMNTEAKSVFKTIDGGESWTEIKSETNINEHKLYQAAFLSEDLGFMSMVCNESPELYRTEDGGKTWSVIGISKTNFYIQPEIPYLENGKMYLLLNEGDSSENQKAMYVSDDNGKSFKFEKEVILK